MFLIGLSGYAQSGKDTVGSLLVEHQGFLRLAFADKVKEALYAINPVVGLNTKTGNPVYLKNFIDSLPGSFNQKWDRAKELEEVRRLLQRLGTEAGRKILGPNVWVDPVMEGIYNNLRDGITRFVITDCRFPNEAEVIKKRGGHMIRVVRPETGPARDSKGHVHESEIALDSWPFDYHIYNEGTLSDLQVKVSNLFDLISGVAER